MSHSNFFMILDSSTSSINAKNIPMSLSIFHNPLQNRDVEKSQPQCPTFSLTFIFLCSNPQGATILVCIQCINPRVIPLWGTIRPVT